MLAWPSRAALLILQVNHLGSSSAMSAVESPDNRTNVVKLGVKPSGRRRSLSMPNGES